MESLGVALCRLGVGGKGLGKGVEPRRFAGTWILSEEESESELGGEERGSGSGGVAASFACCSCVWHSARTRGNHTVFLCYCVSRSLWCECVYRSTCGIEL